MRVVEGVASQEMGQKHAGGCGIHREADTTPDCAHSVMRCLPHRTECHATCHLKLSVSSILGIRNELLVTWRSIMESGALHHTAKIIARRSPGPDHAYLVLRVGVATYRM